MQLRGDKLIKERQVVEQRVDGRAQRCNFYFVNYRALVNVAKYKLDHMRAKLELREKDSTHRACYKCTGCETSYDSLEVGECDDGACTHTIFRPIVRPIHG
jgi:transcription initiation factor TFIIE subunit alpha